VKASAIESDRLCRRSTHGWQLQLCGIVWLLSLAACTSTSEPLITKRGISKVAMMEMTASALHDGIFKAPLPDSLVLNRKYEDVSYLGGIVPFNRTWFGADPADNGTRTRVSINGRIRGSLPLVTTLPKPGPHSVRIEIPLFQRYEVRLSTLVRLRLGDAVTEVWSPIIVDCLSGEIFTAHGLGGVDAQRNAISPAKNLSAAPGEPLLIVTTADRKQASWRKIGQMQIGWAHH
jgi:hypothetical protein